MASWRFVLKSNNYELGVRYKMLFGQVQKSEKNKKILMANDNENLVFVIVLYNRHNCRPPK